jgi:hypothetical protein
VDRRNGWNDARRDIKAILSAACSFLLTSDLGNITSKCDGSSGYCCCDGVAPGETKSAFGKHRRRSSQTHEIFLFSNSSNAKRFLLLSQQDLSLMVAVER